MLKLPKKDLEKLEKAVAKEFGEVIRRDTRCEKHTSLVVEKLDWSTRLSFSLQVGIDLYYFKDGKFGVEQAMNYKVFEFNISDNRQVLFGFNNQKKFELWLLRRLQTMRKSQSFATGNLLKMYLCYRNWNKEG